MRISRFFLMLWILGLTACDSPSPPPATRAESETERSPGYLRLPLDGPVSTLDPGLTQSLDAIELVEQLFLGLTDFDPMDYHVLPELAKQWEVDATGTVYRFTLRDDVLWSNDEPVTAHDVVWAIRRNLSPATASPMVNTLFLLKNAEALHQGTLDDPEQLGARAVEDFLLEFTLEHPAAYFPALASLWTYRPLPRAVVEELGEDWTLPGNIVSNGSYRLREWKKGGVVVLEKNPTYFDARNVSIPAIHYYIVAESSLGLAMYKANELDLLGDGYLRIPLSQVSRIQRDPVLRRQHRDAAKFCTESYAFNTTLAPVDKVLVRKAITASINRGLLIDFIVKSHQPAMTFTRPPIFGSVDPSEGMGIGFNAEQARAWLAEAGYPNGEGLPTIVLVHNVSETHRDIAHAIKVLLKNNLNIEMEAREVDFDTYVDTLYEPEGVHLFRFGWCSDYPDANNWLYENFHPVKSPNFVRWNNAEFADLVEQAQRIAEPSARIALYHRAEQILVEEQVVVLPVYFSTANFLVKPWVKGWYSMAFGGQHLRNWTLQ